MVLFGACRNGLSYTRYMNYRGYPHVYEDVASIYTGHEDIVEMSHILCTTGSICKILA